MSVAMRRVSSALALGAVVAGFVAFAAHAAKPKSAPTLALTSCTLEGLTEAARCGVLEVPENPAKPDGRRIGIHVAVLAATGDAPTRDPIVLLMGGPGEAAIPAASYFAAQLTELRRERDLLFVDQRGAGASNPLACPLYDANDPAASLRDFFPPAAIERCASALRARADLTQYGYARFADDLEAVRVALRYDALNLYAGSYGTRAAQVYVRAYPDRVRTMMLGSIVPIDVPMPLPFAKAAEAQMAATLAACAATPDCDTVFPDIANEFHDVMAKLTAGEVTLVMPDGAEVRLSAGRVGEWMRAKLYRPGAAATLPSAIHQAFLGNWQPIVDDMVTSAPRIDEALWFGLFFAITCNEDIAFIGESDVARETRGTFLGDYRFRQQQAACAHFPKYAVPAAYRKPVRTDVPTLFVSGDRDGGTPMALTKTAARGFANRVEIVMKNRGHTEWNADVGALYAKLVRSGSVKGIDPATVKPEPLPPFRTP